MPPIFRFTRVLLVALSLLFSGSALSQEAPAPLSIGITPVFLDDQLSLLRDWARYLTPRLGRPVEFVQRGSYREIVDLTVSGKLDFAWICGFPYVTAGERLRLLTVPVYQGRPEYRAYLIVPSDDHTTAGLSDLYDKVFAFSDPDSNSGALVIRYQLLQMKKRPEEHFRKTFYTGAHRKVVEAVAAGLADGGAVDGYVWDTLARIEPDLTVRTRVVQASAPYGFPPFVAGPSVEQSDLQRLQTVLIAMGEDEEGRRLLTRMNLDGFTRGERALYDDIERMGRAVAAGH